MKEDQCAIIIDHELPLGIIANTAAVPGVSLGKKIEGMTGNDFPDHSGHIHQVITRVPIPILKNRDLNTLRENLKQHEPDLLVVDLTNHTSLESCGNCSNVMAEALTAGSTGELTDKAKQSIRRCQR